MKTAGQLLDEKGKPPTTIAADKTVLDALRLMAQTDVGAVMVIDEGRLVGVFSERDYSRMTVHEGIRPDMIIRRVMSRDVIAVPPDHSAKDCMALMTRKHIRHLPVLEDGRLIGVVSIRDVVKATLDEKEYIIDQLEGYISGR